MTRLNSLVQVIPFLAAFALTAALQTCGTANYDPAQYVCYDGNFLCPVGYNKCGDACYSPAQYGCVNGQLVFDGLETCGTAQYHPSQYTCYSGFLCPVVNGLATEYCNGACFNIFQYQCVNEALIQIPQTCVTEYMSCETAQGVVLGCCTGLSCVATKCRNLTTIGHKRT